MAQSKSQKPKEISSQIFHAMRGRIPSAERLVDTAIAARIGDKTEVVAFIRANFSALIEDLQKDAYQLYLESERAAGSLAIRQSILEKLPANANADQILDRLQGAFNELDKFFLSLTQSRRSRAGSAFQEITSVLLRRLGYPFEAQPVLEDSKPDYVMPSKAWYDHNASDCIILTLKRTLRERWRQVPTEGNSGSTFILGTIDAKVPPKELDKMKQLNVRLVVPARLKLENYLTHPAVVTFEDFLEDFVDPALKRWKKNGATV